VFEVKLTCMFYNDVLMCKDGICWKFTDNYVSLQVLVKVHVMSLPTTC